MLKKLLRDQWRTAFAIFVAILVLLAISLPSFAANWTETFSGSIPSSWVLRAGTSMTYASSPTHTAGTGSAYRSAGQTSHHWRLTGSRPSYAGEATAWLYCLQDYALVGTSQSRGSYRDVLMLSSYNWLGGMLAVGLYSAADIRSYYIWHNPGSGLVWENIGSRGQHPSARGVFGWVSFKAICNDNNNCYFEAKDPWLTRSRNVTRSAANINAGIWRVAIGLHFSSADPCNWDDITWTGYAPATPTGIAATALSTTEIRWTANAGAANKNQYGFDLMDGGTRKVAGSETIRQTSADLTETGLSANTSYTRSIRAWNGDLNSANSDTASRYTLQNTPTTPTFSNITATGFRVNTTGPANLTAGSSGVVFHDGNADLGKVTQNYIDISGLSANTPYTYKAKACNGDGVFTGYSATATKYTLSVAPIAATVTADTSTPCQDGNVVWTNTLGWGAGKVEYLRYAWDQSATHTWTDTETKWTSGTLTLSPTAAGTWYLHIKGYNAEDVGNGTYDYTVTAQALPNTPTDPEATPSSIGPGGSSVLSATVGNGEEVVWYKDSCGGTVVTSPVSPTETTTYYAKAKNSTTGCLSVSCAQVTVTFVPDDEGPELSNISVTCSEIGGAPNYNFLKGTLTVEAEATDDSGVGSVVFYIDDSETPITMTFDPNTGKYVGTSTIDADWTNGQHSITVVATDIYNNESDDTKNFTVNKNEIEGLVGFEDSFVLCTRPVTFVLNGSDSRVLNLNFINGKAYYNFVDIPEITSISAKTQWHLRSKRDVTMTKGQAEVNFLGPKVLRGGDLATPGKPMGDNVVNALDYAVLRSNWGDGAAGDINGDGFTDNNDYLTMVKYLYVKGDEP